MLAADDSGLSDELSRSVSAVARHDASSEYLEMSEEPLPSGSEIGGFLIVRRIGEGAMGIVYEAEQVSPRRRVALKTLRPGHSGSAAIRRFRLEAESLGRLEHPGIARIFASGTAVTPLGVQHYLAMEFVEGKSLAAKGSATFSTRAVLRVMLEVCDAIGWAHQHGVIHRDIKPQNILMDGQGRVRVIDFGVAAANGIGGGADGTLTGTIVGTLPWAAPEQLDVATAAPDVRSDIHALGMVLYWMLSGRLPFDLNGLALPDQIAKVRAEEPVRLGRQRRGLEGDLEAIVSKATEKSPDLRYQSCHDLAADIRRHLAHEPILARKTDILDRLRKYGRRHKGRIVAAGIALTAVVAGALTSAIAWKDRLQSDRLRSAQFQAVQAAYDDLARQIARLEQSTVPTAVRRGLLQSLLGHSDVLCRTAPSNDAFTELKAEILQQLGTVDLECGDVTAALGRQREAHEIRKDLLVRRPGDRSLRHGLSISLAKLGDLPKEAGLLAEAERYYRAALEIDEALVREDPEDVDALDNLSWSYERVGCLARERGCPREADGMFQLRHGVAEGLVRRWPQHPGSLYGLLCSHSYLASMAELLEDPATAAPHLDAISRLNEDLIRLQPDNPELQKIRENTRRAGTGDAAPDVLRHRAHDARESLLRAAVVSELDPASARHAFDLAAARIHAGRVDLAAGDLSSALDMLTLGARDFDRLIERHWRELACRHLELQAQSDLKLVRARLGIRGEPDSAARDRRASLTAMAAGTQSVSMALAVFHQLMEPENAPLISRDELASLLDAALGNFPGGGYDLLAFRAGLCRSDGDTAGERDALLRMLALIPERPSPARNRIGERLMDLDSRPR